MDEAAISAFTAAFLAAEADFYDTADKEFAPDLLVVRHDASG